MPASIEGYQIVRRFFSIAETVSLICAAGLRWSPCGCGCAVGRIAPGLGGSSGRVCGVCRGRFLLAHFVLCRHRAAWDSSALGSVVASAGRVRPGRWGLPVTAAGLGAVVLGGGGRVRVAGLRVRGGLVGLGRFSAGGAAVCWRYGSGLRRLGAGGRAAVAAAGRSGGAARSGRVGAGRLVGRSFLLVLRGGVADAAGATCRLQRQFSRRQLESGYQNPLLV